MPGSAERMRRYLPALYEGSAVMGYLVEALGAEFDQLEASTIGPDGLRNQLNPTFTSWGLDLLEAALGLPALPTLTDEERRSRVASRMLGPGPMTIYRLHQVANAFENGAVDLDVDYGEVAPGETERYTIRLWFTDIRGVPPNLDAMLEAMRSSAPANMRIEPIYVYTTWDMIEAAGLTWDEFDALGLTWDQIPTHVF